jgi:phosphonate transport system substrate-binding protein
VRVRSYLAPSVPEELFAAVTAHLGRVLGCATDLTFDRARSGPAPGSDDPCTRGEVELAFVCATSYVWHAATRERPSEPGRLRLVGAAWAPTDPRARGRARYLGDLLAGPDGPRSLAELDGATVACNDEVSLSGTHSLLLGLAASGVAAQRVRIVWSGSHLRSLALLRDGVVDAATIDSNVLRRQQRLDGGPGSLRRIAAFGPLPTQPAVTRADLPDRDRRALRRALLTAHRDPRVRCALADAELVRFVGVTSAPYARLAGELVTHPGQRALALTSG